jgi:hypothetical protein
VIAAPGNRPTTSQCFDAVHLRDFGRYFQTVRKEGIHFSATYYIAPAQFDRRIGQRGDQEHLRHHATPDTALAVAWRRLASALFVHSALRTSWSYAHALSLRCDDLRGVSGFA